MQIYESYKARWLENQHLIRAYQRGEQWEECELAIEGRETLIAARGRVSHWNDFAGYWLRLAAWYRGKGEKAQARAAVVEARRDNRAMGRGGVAKW